MLKNRLYNIHRKEKNCPTRIVRPSVSNHTSKTDNEVKALKGNERIPGIVSSSVNTFGPSALLFLRHS